MKITRFVWAICSRVHEWARIKEMSGITGEGARRFDAKSMPEDPFM